jgi:DNA polymerase-3 subunit gamma/tau
MWQSVVEVLHPPGTQALFKQQGRLLALEAASARVGISSQPLFKMAQQRIANLETAFNKLTQQSIRVSLEVVLAAPTPAPTPAPDTASEISSPPSVHSGTPVPAAQSIVREPVRNGNGAVSESAPTYGTAEPSQPTVPVVPTPTTPPTPLPTTPGVSPSWQEEDEVSRAAKSLAQMFNGQIVSGADEVQMSSTETATLVAPDLEVEDGDPDGDVPF